MELLREYERLMVRAGFAVAKKEAGTRPHLPVRFLSLDDLDDDLGAKTDGFENSIYRSVRGLSLREKEELVFDQSVGWRVFDAKNPCALYVARMYHPDSDSTLEWVMARDGARAQVVDVAELPFPLQESAKEIHCSNAEVLAQLVRVFQAIYRACHQS